jgi:hypothetical protein
MLRHYRQAGACSVPLPVLLLALVLWLLFAAPPAAAQQSVNVVPSNYTTFFEYNSLGNPLYRCRAASTQATSSFSVAYGTLVNVVVSGTVGTINFASAHGFLPGYKLIISGSATTALNGTYRVITSDPAATSLTITVTAAGGTYSDMTISTDTALMTKPVWAIQYFYWVGDQNQFKGWTNGNQNAQNQICANRAVVNGPSVVTFR